MVVEQGRISWVGPAANLEVPSGTTSTDLNGAHRHSRTDRPAYPHRQHGRYGPGQSKFHNRASIEKDLKTYASYGVTTVLSMGTDQDAIFPVRNEQRAAASGEANGGPGDRRWRASIRQVRA